MGLRLHPACECDNVGATASTSTSVGRGCVVCVCGAVCGVYLWVLARCVFVGLWSLVDWFAGAVWARIFVGPVAGLVEIKVRHG